MSLLISIFVIFFFISKGGKIDKIEITINNPQKNNFISEKKILSSINKKVKNKKLNDIDFLKLKEEIKKINVIENLDISVTPNYNIKIDVIQRIPICRVFETNKSYYLDKEGAYIENDIEYSPEVLLITGKIDRENKDKILELVRFIDNDLFLKKQLIGMDINEKNEVTFSVLRGNYKIVFGRIEDIESKFLKLEAFYNKYINSDDLSNYKTLNLKFKNQIIGEK